MNEETLNMSYVVRPKHLDHPCEKKPRIYRCEVKILNSSLSHPPKPQTQKHWLLEPSHTAKVDASAGLWLFQRTKIRDQNPFSSASESIKAIHTATSCGSPWTSGHSNAGPTQLPQASPMSGFCFLYVIIGVWLTKEKDMREKHVCA